MSDQETAVIVGTGTGLSASLARKFHGAGMNVVLAARDVDKLAGLLAETNAKTYVCDCADADQVAALFAGVQTDLGTPSVVVFNAGRRIRGTIDELDPEEVKQAVLVTAYGGFLVGQAAAQAMIPAGKGTILFTGASAGVKGFPMSATFAMGKFGLRGLAQSMARELHPKNIHVAHIVIDGGIRNPHRQGRVEGSDDTPDKWLDPDAIADTYFHLHRQDRSAWAWEIELRPWVEKF
jgi:NAD(P)-dependent dehydrogenase (short-subunit alcohol dehydrogenase family)